MRSALVLASLAVATAFVTPFNTLEFLSLNGKRADPCHVGLSTMNPDCVYNQLPDSSVTVLAPAMSSFRTTAITTLTAGTMSVRLTGHNIDATTIARIALSTRGGRCAATEGDVITPTTYDTLKAYLDFTIPVGWLDSARELEEEPRSICFSTNTAATAGGATQWIYTGFKWKVVWSCNNDVANQKCPPPTATTDTRLTTAGVLAADYVAYGQWPMNATFAAARKAQTTCCTSTVGAWAIHQCVNPNVKTCCGGQGLSPAAEKCCSVTTEASAFHDDSCPCYRGTMASDCTAVGETCCLPSKYPELNTVSYTDQKGECYNSTTHQCCDTGHRFDAGAQQCCVINGIQSLNKPCPCANDTHCVGSWADATDDEDFVCCRQSSPMPWESAYESRTSAGSIVSNVCDKYANFPNGTGPYEAQPCLGNCINKKYQICCNGVACVGAFDNCCNSTCCNKYVGACSRGRRSGSPGQWNNPNDFAEEFDVCSTTESMNTVKAFWIFVLPTELMFGTFACLAFCLAFAARSKHAHEFSITERIMVGVAVLTILFAVPLFFAPIYKYGVVVAIVSLFAIITASARVRGLNIVCVLLQVLALLYLFDPMHGNHLLNTSSGRLSDGTIDAQTMGVLHSTAKMFKSVGDVQTNQYCQKFYQYFTFDPLVRDFDRFDNPEVTTFGYCSRAWVVALFLFEGAILMLLLVQFVLDMLALIVRFKAPSFDPVQLEVQGKQPEY